MKQRFYTFLNTCFMHNNKETLLHISNRNQLGKEKGNKKLKARCIVCERKTFSEKYLRVR
jgi:hypothetical protein